MSTKKRRPVTNNMSARRESQAARSNSSVSALETKPGKTPSGEWGDAAQGLH